MLSSSLTHLPAAPRAEPGVYPAEKPHDAADEKPDRENFVNDLEWAVLDDYQELQTIKALYPKSVMSGSGSAYYMLNDEFEPMKGYWVKNNLKAVPSGVKIV